jgi:DNA-binding MarR family transcriptional regulator
LFLGALLWVFACDEAEKGAYMDYLSFSKKEWEILICFWNAHEPLCCSDFSERFGLNRNTSLSVIRKLVNKGVLEVESIKMSGSVLARRFQPTVSELEVLQTILDKEQISDLLAVAIHRLGPKQLDLLLAKIAACKQKLTAQKLAQ